MTQTSRVDFSSYVREYGFRVSLPLQAALQRRTFPGENKGALIRRLLLQLRDAIAGGDFKENNVLPFADTAAKPCEYSLHASEEVEDFIEEWRKRLSSKWDTYVLNFLLNWAVQLPIVEPIQDKEVVYDLLVQEYGMGGITPIAPVLDRLCRLCDVQSAKAFLVELRDSGQIKLNQSRKPTQKIKLQGLMYDSLQIVPQGVKVTLSKMRLALHLKSSQRVRQWLQNGPVALKIDQVVAAYLVSSDVLRKLQPSRVGLLHVKDYTQANFFDRFWQACHQIGVTPSRASTHVSFDGWEQGMEAIAIHMKDGEIVYLVKTELIATVLT